MDESKLCILVMAGTNREQRKSIMAARLIYEIGRQREDIEVIFVDPKDFYFPGDGNDPEGKDPRYSELTSKADGFFIITPEYNHSFPGTLKRMLDSELKNYIHKPVAFAGVSGTMWGGVRAIEALLGPVREMGLVATYDDVFFPHVQDQFDEQGKLTNDFYNGAIKKAYDELIWMAKALKHARDSTKTD